MLFFRRKTEGVPAHGLEHVLSEHALVAGYHVADGVVAHVAHVQFAAGVGEHGKAIVFFPFGILGDFEDPALFPVSLGLGLDFGRVVTLLHGGFRSLGDW